MRKWKFEKKQITIAILALLIIVVAILFQHLLEQETRFGSALKTIKNTFAPIFFGFVLAYLLNPVLQFFEKYLFIPFSNRITFKKQQEKRRKELARGLSVFCTVCTFLAFLAGCLCMVIPQVYASIAKIIEELPIYYTEIEKFVLRFLEEENQVGQYVLQLFDTVYLKIMDYVNNIIVPNAHEIVKEVTTGIIGGVKTILNILLAIVISIYVLLEKEKIISCAKKMVYSYFDIKQANTVMAGARHANLVFGGFVNGKIVDSFIIGILCYIFMIIVGFEYSVLISIIIGVTNVIPYFGPFIGAIPSILILLMTEPKQGLIFAIFILILQQLDGNVIGPLILGESLKISSMWILFAILVGGGLFGVKGMVLGPPTLACIYALIGTDCRKKLKEKELPTESKDYLQVDRVKENKEIVYFESNGK